MAPYDHARHVVPGGLMSMTRLPPEVIVSSAPEALAARSRTRMPSLRMRFANACPRSSQRQSSGGIWLVTGVRSEEHTSELQSLTNLVCRLLLEKKKNAS